MSTLASFIMTTLDGFYEGPNQEFDFWLAFDDEFVEFSVEQLDSAETLVFGRVTYEGGTASRCSSRCRIASSSSSSVRDPSAPATFCSLTALRSEPRSLRAATVALGDSFGRSGPAGTIA